MNLLCEECVSFAICINEVTFDSDRHYSYGLAMQFNGIQLRCDYFLNKARHIHSDEYQEIKRFFLINKGIIQDE